MLLGCLADSLDKAANHLVYTAKCSSHLFGLVGQLTYVAAFAGGDPAIEFGFRCASPKPNGSNSRTGSKP
jgi:hypothetical protein